MPSVRGENVVLTLGPERVFGGPGGGLESINWQPPLNVNEGGKLEADKSISRTGFARAGVQGEDGGAPVDLEIDWDPARLLPFLVHIAGKVSKTNPAAGVYRYVIEPARNPLAAESFFAAVKPDFLPWKRMLGLMFGSCETALKTGLLSAKLKGMSAYSTAVGEAVASEDNTGTYGYKPVLKGVLKNPSAGPVTVKVVSVSPLKVRCAQGAAPVAGPQLSIPYGVDGFATWMSVQGEDGLDLGIVRKNVKRPLELLFPGKAVSHGLLAVGDSWTFPAAVAEPDITEVAGDGKFSLFHLGIRARPIGGEWIEIEFEDGQFKLNRKIDLVRGGRSSEPLGIEVAAPCELTGQFSWGAKSDFFLNLFKAIDPFELEMAFEAQQITASHRVGIVIHVPAGQIEEEPKRSFKPGRTMEEVSFGAKELDGAVPFSITVTTARNYSIPTYISE